MDNFDLKKYLAEGKLNEEANPGKGLAIDDLIEKLDKYVMQAYTDPMKAFVYQARAKEIENIKNAFNYGQTNPGMEVDEYLNFMNFK